MAEIVSVRFRSEGKQYYFDPQGLTCRPGDGLIVETASGQEFAHCVRGNFRLEEAQLVSPLRPVIRLATQEDLAVVEKNREKEKYAFRVCQEKILEHELEMKLVSVECNFEGTKILFFFTSDGRVDFRGLVKSLAAVFHTRIELRQIGIRDEAKMLGGLGICGRPFCCSSFLREFQPVSIKMAKTQNLSLNPTKISGTCGRLMCCLKYEQNAYEDLMKGAPKADSFVETPDGAGTINSVNTLREQVRVRLDSAPDSLKTQGGAGQAAEGQRVPRGPVPPGAGRPGRRPGRVYGGAPGGCRPSRPQQPLPPPPGGPGQERRTGRARPGGRGGKGEGEAAAPPLPPPPQQPQPAPPGADRPPQLGRPGRGGHGAGGGRRPLPPPQQPEPGPQQAQRRPTGETQPGGPFRQTRRGRGEEEPLPLAPAGPPPQRRPGQRQPNPTPPELTHRKPMANSRAAQQTPPGGLFLSSGFSLTGETRGSIIKNWALRYLPRI